MEQLLRLLRYVLLALVQGLGEILPVSSSGHLVMTYRLMRMEPDLSFEIFLHFASLLAILVFFRRRLVELIRDFFLYVFRRERGEDPETAGSRKRNFRMCLYLVIATVPAALAGVLLDDLIEEKLSTLLFVGIFLLVTAALLTVSRLFRSDRELGEMKWYDALVIGLFQCLGIMPGISRSGSCIVGGKARRFRQADAAEFAFLMAIPIMLGSAVLKVPDLLDSVKADGSLVLPYLVSFVITAVVTYLCLHFFLKIIRRKRLTFFSVYCALAGITAIVLHFVL